ncbi:MAG: hypothetical protein K1W16_04010 [Lachnospiraceae bacterium]
MIDRRRKPYKYWIRDEFEEIIKEKNVNRSHFYEYSKFSYNSIIKKFYYSFADYKKYPQISLSYCWLHFRENDLTMLNRFLVGNYGWTSFLEELHASMPVTIDNKFYLLLSQGWVYEGYADAIFSVLKETDGLLEDFYIVSRNFDWFISYCEDGECAVIYQR